MTKIFWVSLCALFIAIIPLNAALTVERARVNKATDKYIKVVRQTAMLPARKLMTPQAYAKYKADLWSMKCKIAAATVQALIEKRYPRLMAVRPKAYMNKAKVWWWFIRDRYYIETFTCRSLSSLSKADQYLAQFDQAKKRLKKWHFRIPHPKTTIEEALYYRRLALDNSARSGLSDDEVGMIGFARYLLDRNDKYKPDWMAIQSDVPLFLLTRSALVAKKNGDPDNKPPDFDKLLARAKVLAGPERAKLVFKFVDRFDPRTYITYILKTRLAETGKSLREAENLPPFFFDKKHLSKVPSKSDL